MCDMRDFIYRAIECVFVCVRRLGESAQLPDELKRRCANLIIRRGRTAKLCRVLMFRHMPNPAPRITRIKTDLFLSTTCVWPIFLCVWRGKHGPT